MHTILKSLALVALTATAVTAQAADAVTVDPKLPAYAVTSGVSGNLNSVGSDTLNNLMTFWSEGFKAQYPNVKIQVEGKGSGTVHKDNAIKGLSLKQVDGIFASTRKRGGQDVVTWGDLGQQGALAGKTVSAFGRNSASGTYGYFKEVALKNGDFKDTVKEQPGSSSVVQGIAADVGAVGYSGIGYATSGVRALPLSTDPSKPMDKLTSEFITFVLSKQGQEIVIKDGYFPLPADVADEGRASLKYYSAE